MRRIIIILGFTILIINITKAQKWDYQWLFGYNANIEYKFGMTLMDFNNEDVDVSYYRESKYYELGNTGSFIDDMYGNLMLVTNNCDVRDANWNVISGDSFITPTGNGVNGCKIDHSQRYSAGQSTIFLPDLIDSTTIYLVHKDYDIDYDNMQVFSNNMYLSTIKTNGQYIYQKSWIDSTKNKIGFRLTSIPNRKKNKWWIYSIKNHSNVFKKYLVGSDTVVEVDTQSIGIVLNELDLGIGQTQFSPDGTMLGINTEKHGVLLYDFDNETGRLSNFRSIPYPNSDLVASGLCFSPNSRFIYVTTAEDVYQIDLDENNEIYHVGTFWSPSETGWPVGVGMIFSGPDCKLYVSPGTTTHYIHVILYPDNKGIECKFVEKAINLPTKIPFDLPNLPQYRYLTACDTTISFPFATSVLDEVLEDIDFKIYPNPATDYIELILTKMDRWYSWQIFDIMGNMVLKGQYIDMQKIDISGLKSGIYIMRVEDKKGGVYIARFVKQE